MKVLNRLSQIGIACALKKLKHAIFMDADTRNICALNGAYDYLMRYKKALQSDIAEHKAEPAEKNHMDIDWSEDFESAEMLYKMLSSKK